MCKVLLCDDDRHYRLLLKEVLTPLGVEIVGEAADGVACIDLARTLQPDLILLDLNMPRMDGLAALPQLRAAAPDASVVVLSTAEAHEACARSKKLGARGFVHKPADIFTLPSALRAAIAA